MLFLSSTIKKRSNKLRKRLGNLLKIERRMDALSAELRQQILVEVDIIKNQSGTPLSDALASIFDLSANDDVKLALSDTTLGLIDRLVVLLRYNNDEYVTAWCVSVITRLSASVHHNKQYLTTEERGICTEFVRLITQENVKNNIYVFFANCVLNSVTIPYLLSERLGLVEAAKVELENNFNYKFVYTFFANAVTTMSNQYCAYFIRLGIHELIVNRLIQAGPNPVTWEDRNTGAIYRSMGFVTSFSTLPDGCLALKALNRKQYFLSFLEATANEKERMQAAIIMANLYGQDEEAMTSQSLLQLYPNVLQLLVNLLASIVGFTAKTREAQEYRHMGLAFGVTKMRDATAALLKLSMQEKNKPLMLQHSSFLAYALKAVELFITNAGQCFALYQGFQSFAGGGGEDFDSIQNLIELFLQLSFYEGEFDDTVVKDQDVKDENENDDSSPSFKNQLIEKLNALLQLPTERKVPYDTLQCTSQVLHHLEGNPKVLLSKISPAITLYSDDGNESVYDELETEAEDEEDDHHDDENHEDEEDEVHDNLPNTTGNNNSAVNNNTTTTSSVPVEILPPQHIMFSCAPNAANHEYVIDLAQALRKVGYDTWLDEEGSGLIPGLLGIDEVDKEVIIDAVDHSYAVIIFVSKEYRDSPACRFTAEYAVTKAATRGAENELKVLYVMLDEQFTPYSRPTAVDGWLGYLIGAGIWYPLWHINHIDTTAQSLSDRIGHHAKVFHDSKPNNFVPPYPSSHLFFSYAPNSQKNRDLFVELRQRLKHLNYDVWSYEEGSSLVPSIFSTSTSPSYPSITATDNEEEDDRRILREALRVSHAMVIFVSKEYRDHPDCRYQAAYGQSLLQSGQLTKIIYVMLDENFHTTSHPVAVDGWLGFMIGLEIWCPLWERTHIETTMESIISVIGGHCKASNNQRYRYYFEKVEKAKRSKFQPTLPSFPTANAFPISNTVNSVTSNILFPPPPPLNENKLVSKV